MRNPGTQERRIALLREAVPAFLILNAFRDLEKPVPFLENRKLVDKGFCSDVYEWEAGSVLKLFHANLALERADREFDATRIIHAAGAPAPAAYELLEVEGRWGIVFERINGVSMLGYTQAKPWTLFAVIRQFAELHAQIHRCKAPPGLESLHERITARIEASDSPVADKQTALTRLAELPGGISLCHGDFHPANVLLTKQGPVVIDWSSGSCGDPIGDVACTSRLMHNANLPPWSPAYMHVMLKCLRSAMHRSYLTRYFRLQPGTPQQIEAWDAPLAVAARSWRR
jgi:aminoglycoside phosphotransferase (APT) family kinase protein